VLLNYNEKISHHRIWPFIKKKIYKNIEIMDN